MLLKQIVSAGKKAFDTVALFQLLFTPGHVLFQIISFSAVAFYAYNWVNFSVGYDLKSNHLKSRYGIKFMICDFYFR